MSLPLVSETTFTERAGVLRVAAAVNEARCLWRETPLHDVGIDGQIEYVDGDLQATGRLILVQAKSGDSYFESERNGRVSYTPAPKHREYWDRAPLPVILVLNQSSTGVICWADARSQLRAGAKTIVLDTANVFDAGGVRDALAADGPLPTGATDVDQVIGQMIANRIPSAGFPIDFFDLFVHGLVELGRTVYFGMEMVIDLVETVLALRDYEFGMDLNASVYDFLAEYVRFLVSCDLARVDFDNFRRFEDLDFVSSFMAPLTPRGLATVERINELDSTNGVRVAQDKVFQGIWKMEYLRRVPVVEGFKSWWRTGPVAPSPESR